MSPEEIIRNEANAFMNGDLKLRINAIDEFEQIKTRLNDFYPDQNKAIFLDEIKIFVTDKLQKHRDKAHGGLAKKDCPEEIRAEKLIFYIQQEVDTFPKIIHENIIKSKREKVFVSYSHADKLYLNDIKRHFKPFLEKIDFWDDSKIMPGDKWLKEIENAVSQAKIAIFLVSTDFLGSDFIARKEIPPLLEAAEKDGITILMVILKPCLFDGFPSLSQYQAMNAPSHPVSKMDENEREELYVNLVRQTKKILEK